MLYSSMFHAFSTAAKENDFLKNLKFEEQCLSCSSRKIISSGGKKMPNLGS
jgi:hypothetical protein